MALLRNLGLAVAAVFGLAMPVAAQDLLSPQPLAGVIDELRFGVAAHQAHYTLFPTALDQWRLNQIEDVSFDVLFVSPDMDAFRWIGSPRPEVGATLNLAGHDSIAHLALTWQLPVFDTPVFLEGSFGAAIHDGYLTGAPVGRQNFGCRVNFYERYGIGANINDHTTVSLQYEHTSNAELCPPNGGLSNLGLRVGWKF